jgi:hypothetical protein
MVVKKVIDRCSIESSFTKLILGAVLAALLVSLGMNGILRLLGFSVNPAIPSVFASIGAAIYAAVVRKEER